MTTLLLMAVPAIGQTPSCSLSGTASDASGAVVPGATVVIENEATHVKRSLVTNGSGLFSFAALLPGSYTVTISSPGLATWVQQNITLHQDESRSIPNIQMKVAASKEEVTVASSVAGLATLDTGENRETLNQHMVTQLSIQGRDAGELLKLMPGMAMNRGLNNQEWNSLVTHTNQGPVGNFAANGTQPNGGVQLTMDGANNVDTADQGDQLVNINQDQTAELTVRTSAFDAQYAHGPAILQATGKSGGAQFHGGAYLYGRNGSLNSEDSYVKNQGLSKPIDRYWYPGFDIGGPVLIPSTDFNKGRNKLFFYGGFEYMYQHPAGTLHEIFTPTQQMLQGNFSQSYLNSLGINNYGAISNAPCTNMPSWQYPRYCGSALGLSEVQNGMINPAAIDPNALAMTKLFPTPNIDPLTHQGNNFEFLDNPSSNRSELRLRADYNINDKTNAYVQYGRQSELETDNFGVWWAPGDSMPYPSPITASELGTYWSVGLTHIFNPTLTNETTFTYASYNYPTRMTKPSAVDPSNIGFTAQSVYQPKILPQVPNIYSWSCDTGNYSGCFPGSYNSAYPSGFENGAFGAFKRTPAISDNLAWVKGSHTLKFGVYWEQPRITQTDGYGAGNMPQGAYEFETWAYNTTGNILADFLLGNAYSYAQVSLAPVEDTRYNQFAFYAQDQWKVTRRLTLDFGIRMERDGQWYPTNTPGVAAWDPAAYSNDPTAPLNTGIVWNAMNSSVPTSGWATRMLPDPRVGVAYDLFGTGKTVLRGGFGLYRYQIGFNDFQQTLSVPLGKQSFTTNCDLTSFAQASTCAGATPSRNSLNITTFALNDNRSPYTENWDFLIDQQGPWHSLFTIGYTGSRSYNELIGARGGQVPYMALANLNKIPMGALFQPDPVTGVTYCTPGNCTISNSKLPDFRPYANYATIGVLTHGSYANYNALQASWQKQAGRGTFLLNYTWSKAMGTRDGTLNGGDANGENGNGAVIDTFNLADNYGLLAYDRTHIFNAAYVIALPGIHTQNMLRGVVNGWEFAGDTQFQSGPPLQPNTVGTLNVKWPNGVSNQSILGTDAAVLVPALTCDPRSGLQPGQYFNPNCFGVPTPGSNGSVVWPAIKGPGFFNSDLALYKNFSISERQKLQFRISAFNVLNHPQPQFGLGNDVNLTFGCPSGQTCSPASPSQYVNVNKNTTGRPLFTVGNREVEFALKYTF